MLLLNISYKSHLIDCKQIQDEYLTDHFFFKCVITLLINSKLIKYS